MTPQEIEKKALEKFPPIKDGSVHRLSNCEVDYNEESRGIYIQGFTEGVEEYKRELVKKVDELCEIEYMLPVGRWSSPKEIYFQVMELITPKEDK